ncbi:MAG: tetratricopeptide repeat protein [Bryobacterales bacterium]|nr:tetratricopeptide repeat protein [Bryobacterales bacterium]
MTRLVYTLLLGAAMGLGQEQSVPSERDLRRAVAAHPRDPRPHTEYGILLMRQDRVREAIPQFQAALGLDPRSADAVYNLGLALLHDNQAQAALAALDKHPAETADYYALRGIVLNALNREPEAVQSLRRAVALDPNNPDSLYDLALTLAKAGADAEASALLNQGRRRFPKVAKIHAASGMMLYAAGQNDQAVQAYEQAVQLEPDAADLFAALGDAYDATGNLTKAEGAYLRSLRLEPSNAACQVKYGRNQIKLQNPRKAEAAFQQALAHDGHNADAHFELGKLANASSNTAAAISHFEQAVAANPSLKAAWYQLSLGYHRAGQEEKSRAAKEQFQKLP